MGSSRYVTSIAILTGVAIGAAAVTGGCQNRPVEAAVPAAYTHVYRTLASQLGPFEEAVRGISAQQQLEPGRRHHDKSVGRRGLK